MKQLNLFVLLYVLAFMGVKGLSQEHRTKDLPSTKQKTALQDLNRQLHAMAEEYGPKYGQLPRVAPWDVAYPSSPEEDEALNRYAALLITVVTQEAGELPIKRVYIRNSHGGETDLRVLGSYYTDTSGDSLVHEVLGPYRAEVFCLLPIASVFTDATLQVDFAKNRKGFMLKKFPMTPPEKFLLRDKEAYPDPKKSVSDRSIETLLLREFPDFKTEKFSSQPPS